MLYVTDEPAEDARADLKCDGTIYPLRGQEIDPQDWILLTRFFQEQQLLRFAGCMEKAVATYLHCGFKEKGYLAVAGDMRVFDGDTAYGFDFNPPHEFHVWLERRSHANRTVVDVSLPGVIERAHERGYLTHVQPFAIAGSLDDSRVGLWYNPRVIMDVVAAVAINCNQ